MTDKSGQRRLDDPGDWVSQEIAAALQQNLPVFPVLIEDTPMPRAEDLPDALKPLETLEEPIAMFFGSTIIATAILVCMNLSGVKSK